MKRCSILLLTLSLAGCVTTGKFKEQQDQAAAQRKRAEAAEAKQAETAKQLDAALASAGAAAEAAKKAEADLTARLKAGEGQLASAKAHLDSAGTQLASVQKSNKDLQESLEAKKGELNKKVSDLIKQRDLLSQKGAALEAEAAELRKTLAASESERKALVEAKAALEAEKRSLEDAKAAELLRVRKNYEELTTALKSEIAAGEIKITQLQGKLTVNMVDRILFDSGQAEVKPEGRKVLEKVGELLKSVVDKDIRIEGHTDNKPIGPELRSRYPTNWELSTARATAVARYLEDRARIDPLRLVATGYGQYRPIAPNESFESRALNRRIEIVLVPRD